MHKKDGFLNEISIQLDRDKINKHIKHPLIRYNVVTDVGFYPNAKNHYRERLSGVDEFILIYCLKGKGEVQIDKFNKRKLKQGHALIIYPNMIHRYFSDQKDPWSILWMHFNINNSFLLDLNLHYEKTPFIEIKSEIKDYFIQRHFSDIMEYAKMKQSLGTTISLSNSLRQVLTDIYFLEDPLHKNTRYFNRAIAYLKQNVSEQISVNDIATHLNISEIYVNKIFKQASDRTPISYFNSMKITQAKQMLSITEQSIKEIAHDLGFNDPYYFSRLFKKETQFSPTVYRETARKTFSNSL